MTQGNKTVNRRGFLSWFVLLSAAWLAPRRRRRAAAAPDAETMAKADAANISDVAARHFTRGERLAG